MSGAQGKLQLRPGWTGIAVAAEPIPAGSAWQLSAACRNTDGTWFFASDKERAAGRIARTARAKAVCAACPVIAECRAHALATREPFGIWGGLTEEERATALRARRRAQLRLTQAMRTVETAPGT